MKKSADELFVWVRLGDSCEYEKYDDIAGATDCLTEAGVHGPFQWGLRGKLFASGYEMENYISFFWGNKSGDFVRDLKAFEKAAVEKEFVAIPDMAKIRKGCEKVSKDLKTEIRIHLDDKEVVTTKESYVEAKTKQLVDFGYGTLTEDHVADQLNLLLAGKTTMAEGLTVIGMFMKDEVVR